MKKRRQPGTAIVIGASMAGLFTARVLSGHFGKVYLVERDPVPDQPEPRKGQPQAKHAHLLLARGLETMQLYFPGLLNTLSASGATVCDPGQNMVWNTYGDYRSLFALGRQNVFVSRPFLEWKVRQQVLELENVELLAGFSVDCLRTDEKRRQVTGVQISSQENKEVTRALSGDFIVDASGRGSRSGKWLEELGYEKPRESKVRCGMGYTTRIYQREPERSGIPAWVAVTPKAPEERRGGAALPVEGNRWIVSLAGWHGDHAPKNEAAFLAFAKSLPAPDLYHIVSQCKPISDISVHKLPSSLRRHYEKLPRFPQGYLVLGDAVCSFNPVYGQGMTSSILQAAALDELLKERGGDTRNFAKPYFQRIANVIDTPWQTAVGEDFRFPETTGKKQPGTDLINVYLSQLHLATHTDPVVSKVLIEVLNMLEPPTRLLRPQIMARVFRSALRQRFRKKQPRKPFASG